MYLFIKAKKRALNALFFCKKLEFKGDICNELTANFSHNTWFASDGRFCRIGVSTVGYIVNC